MKILITGGCGFLGSNLAASFLDKGYDVFVIDTLERDGSALNLGWLETHHKNNHLHFSRFDVADDDLLLSFFRNFAPFDYVCHVAGQVAMTTSLVNPKKDLRTNIIGTFNALEAVRKYSPDALFAYSSTNKVYGDLEWINKKELDTRYFFPDFPTGLDESLPLDFSTPYGCSKGAADQYVHDWSRVYGLKTVVFRHSSIYGGRQYSTYDQGWIGWFCTQAIDQLSSFNKGHFIEPFTISGTGKQVRDVLHADDLVRLYHLAFMHQDIASGQIFNIGGGPDNSLSLLELFSYLSQVLALPSLSFICTPRRSSDQDYFVASIAKAKALLNWEPSVGYREGIKRMVEWCSRQS